MIDIPEITWVSPSICVCDNCGAYADVPENIQHAPTGAEKE